MFKKQVKCIECGFLGLNSIRGFQDPVLVMDEILPQNRINLAESYKEIELPVGCSRGQDHIIAASPPLGKAGHQEKILQNVYLDRKCMYYYPYNPGYTPEQHLELLRERTQRKFLIIVSVLSATVGAAIATIVNLVW